jgi:hypothetical protein
VIVVFSKPYSGLIRGAAKTLLGVWRRILEETSNLYEDTSILPRYAVQICIVSFSAAHGGNSKQLLGCTGSAFKQQLVLPQGHFPQFSRFRILPYNFAPPFYFKNADFSEIVGQKKRDIAKRLLAYN